MTTEELNFDLFTKMDREMNDFIAWLSLQSPEEVMRHAYEFVVKSDILSTLEDFSLTEKHARALLMSETPLEEIYRMHNRDWDSARKRIEETIQSFVENLVERNAANVATEVYPHSEMYAEEFGEWEMYQLSTHLNIQCKEAIDDVVQRYFSSNTLDPEALHLVAEQFGVPRIRFVLANTVLAMQGDDRIAAEHKAWARSVPIFADLNSEGANNRNAYVVKNHPQVINALVKTLHQEYPLSTVPQKISVREKLKVKPKKIRRIVRRISSNDQER